MSELKLKESRGAAQRRFDEISRLILDQGEGSLTDLLARAVENGMERGKGREVFQTLRRLSHEAEIRFEEICDAPTLRTTAKSRVAL